MLAKRSDRGFSELTTSPGSRHYADVCYQLETSTSIPQEAALLEDSAVMVTQIGEQANFGRGTRLNLCMLDELAMRL